MTKIEIYNYDTNEPYAIFETRKKNTQRAAIEYLKANNFKMILQGTVKPDLSGLYWLAHNSITNEDLKLWYREQEKEKEQNENKEEVIEEMEK